MKRSTLLPILIFAQVAISILIAGMTVLVITTNKAVTRQTAAIERFSQNQRAVNILIADTAEYAKRNPSILPVLSSMGFNVTTNAAANPGNPANPGNAPAPRSAPKPPGR